MAATLTNVKGDAASGVFSCTVTNDGSAAAYGIYCGFAPRKIEIYRTDAAGNTFLWFDGMAQASNIQITNAGALTVPATNGVSTVDPNIAATLTAAAASTVAATGSPNSSGPGFVLGTGIATASSTFRVVAYR